MAKHLIGFGLFVLIVGFFVVAYAVMTLPPLPSLDPEISPLAKLPTECKFGPSSRISQTRAIADRKTGKLTIYISSIPADREMLQPELNARFTIFTVRGDELRVVDTIDDSLAIKVNRDDEAKWVLSYRADWITELSWGDTLYIVPAGASSSAAMFSKDNAVSVLIRN
jgi:hypothetical protein